jgi:hypothetical protein
MARGCRGRGFARTYGDDPDGLFLLVEHGEGLIGEIDHERCNELKHGYAADVAVTDLAVSHASHSSRSERFRISVMGHLCTVKKVFLGFCLGTSGRRNHRTSQRRQVNLGEPSLSKS